MSYLTRNKIYEKIPPNKDAKKVYIVCEGQDTEYKYFKYFEGFSSNIDIIPIPSINGKSDPMKLKAQAVELFFGNLEKEILPKYTISKEYRDEVWFVIDTDRWNEGNKIEELKEFCNGQNGVLIPCWHVAQSNPCFEIWQYYHFFEDKPIIEDLTRHKSFKHFVNESIKGGFDNRTMPIEVDIAVSNSMANYGMNELGQPSLYSTQVHDLGKVILSFIGSELNRIKLTIKKQENRSI